MNLREREVCDGLDDLSIIESMAWLKEQCVLLHLELERASAILTDKGGAERLPKAGSEQ
jgi:hypothetical protein